MTFKPMPPSPNTMPFGASFDLRGIDHRADARGNAAATVIGSKSGVASAYPAASAAHQIQLPNEEPLGYRIDAMPELEQPSTGLFHSPVEQTDGPLLHSTATSPSAMSSSGPSSFSTGDPAVVSFPSHPTTRSVDAGSPTSFKRRRL
jgi:hypothetical protein